MNGIKSNDGIIMKIIIIAKWMQFIIFTAIHGGWMDGGVPPIEREKLT